MSEVSQTHESRFHIPGILAALGGRWGWRWWFPLLIWTFRVVIGRINMPSSPDLLRIDDTAAGWFLLSSVAALLVLWGWGSRFALSLGYRRSQVFATTAVASVLYLVGVQLLTSLANQVEIAIVGADGPRVLALEVGEKLGADSGVFHAGLLAAQIHLMPLAIGLVLALCWTMRWSVAGMVAGLVTAAGLIYGMLMAWAFTDRWAPGPQEVTGLMAMVLCISVMLALAWAAYRRVPV